MIRKLQLIISKKLYLSEYLLKLIFSTQFWFCFKFLRILQNVRVRFGGDLLARYFLHRCMSVVVSRTILLQFFCAWFWTYSSWTWNYFGLQIFGVTLFTTYHNISKHTPYMKTYHNISQHTKIYQNIPNRTKTYWNIPKHTQILVQETLWLWL